ncbi:trans-aconitate 2-methyltransferase [Actinomadura sp. WMMB 499]|uniref:class I SAM-dependent methyltransferase n=1 Tax=Actinomadura sp. WMMB 499 TaxID=1219491 RepID=UPI0012480D9D|nr:class I SAM-dependent methyltransferase [Actinomadura sp. WMMB 499]QFG25505.1 class I SAM-dependent methyltransferase [Actinomadura sp. WMMB 499]
MTRRLDDAELEASPVVANIAMNRERTLASYRRELGVDPLAEAGTGHWLDLCCGTGRALVDAAGESADVRITGVDLVGHFLPGVPPPNVRLVVASVTVWEPAAPADLITCVHGLHYVGDKLGLLARAASWLTGDGLLVADFDPRSVRLAGGSPAGRPAAAALRRAGFALDTRRHRITLRGRREITLPYRYLGADDRAGPNYTGQPAVDSYYAPEPVEGER